MREMEMGEQQTRPRPFPSRELLCQKSEDGGGFGGGRKKRRNFGGDSLRFPEKVAAEENGSEIFFRGSVGFARFCCYKTVVKTLQFPNIWEKPCVGQNRTIFIPYNPMGIF